MTDAHRVAVVVAPRFAVELHDISADRHVWALRVPEYERIAEDRWSTAKGDDLDSGITLFNGGGLDPEAEFVAILATVEEHHGEYSHAPPLSEIEVFGAQPTSEVLAELRLHGFDRVSRSERGFTARRDVCRILGVS